MSRLVGRVALVTGASSGIGAAVARELADAGCAVIGAARRFTEMQPHPRPGEICDVHMDVTVDDDVDRVVGALPAIDVLVHAAGSAHFGPADSLDAEMIRTMLEVHLVGSARCTRAALPALRSGGAQVVFVGSIATRVAIADNAGYTAAKNAQIGYARSLAVEEQRHGVRVMSVVLGATDTEAWRQRPSFDRSQMSDSKEVASILVGAIGWDTVLVEEIVIRPPAGLL